jgi:hypothetical protein
LLRLLRERPDVEEVRRYALRFGWQDVISKQCALYERVARKRRAVTCD